MLIPFIGMIFLSFVFKELANSSKGIDDLSTVVANNIFLKTLYNIWETLSF